MKIILRMNNINYDITNLVDKNNLSRTVEMKHTIDGEFHTASIYIPLVKKHELGNNIDFSKGIIRNSLVTIEIDNRKYQWRVMSDTVTDKLNDTYAHDIALIDRRSELTGYNLPGLTLTQKSFVSNEKVRAIMSSTEDQKVDLHSNIIWLSSDNRYMSIFYINDKVRSGAAVPFTFIYTLADYVIEKFEPYEKVLANIANNNSITNPINKTYQLSTNNRYTSNSTFIELQSNKIILKKKNQKYDIKIDFSAFDATPQVSNKVTWPYNNTYISNFIPYTNSEILVKIYSNGIEKYNKIFTVNKSRVHRDYQWIWDVYGATIWREKWTVDFPISNNTLLFSYTPTTDNEEITVDFSVTQNHTTEYKLEQSEWVPVNTYRPFNLGGSNMNVYTYGNLSNESTNIFNTLNNYGYLDLSTTADVYIRSSETYQTITEDNPYGYVIQNPDWLEQNYIKANKNVSIPISRYLAIQDVLLVVETEAEIVSRTTKTLEDWMDHILDSVFIDEDISYTLDSSTRARLSQYTSPEFTIKDYNLYQAISEVAEFLGGVNWEITENNEIKFIFFNELPIQDLPEDVDIQAIDGVSDLNGYQSSLQINAENIYLQSLTTEGWYSPRAEEDGNINISNDKIMIKTNYPINAIYKAEMKGINYAVPGYNANTIINITPRIVEYEEWKTLPSQYSIKSTTDDEGRRAFLKGNTLYYKRGEPGIYGLGYCGGVEPGFWTTDVGNRAIFETGATQIFTENSYGSEYNTTQKDQGNTTDNNFRLKIQYYPFTDAKTIVYKDDLSGFQLERTAYMNESSQVNDPNLLGAVAKSRVNRLGGTEYTKSGYISSMLDLPRLGSANSAGQRLTELVTQTTDSYIKYFATYINDYNKISTFVGKKSDYRLYEVPNKNILKSTRVKRVRFAISPVADINENLAFDIRYIKIFQNMTYDSINPPVYHLPPNLVRLGVKNKTVYLPVLTGNIGSTAFWKFEAKDNYSVGENYVNQSLGGKSWKLQQDVSYVNEFGNFEHQLGLTFLNGEVAYPNIYPDATAFDPVTGTNIFYESIDYDKDAREILSVEYQYSFHSTNTNEVMLFNGISEFNSFLNGRTDYEIVAAPCYYKPNKEDILVDFSKIDPHTNTDYVKFEPSSLGLPGTYRLIMRARSSRTTTDAGMVLYDNRTKKLIMWIKYPGTTTANQTFITTVYVRMLDTHPILIDVNFVIPNQFLDLDIPNQQFKADITGIQVSDYLTPYKNIEGYTFDGVYFDENLTTRFYSGSLSSDATLYLKYTPIISTKTWVETNNTIYDEEINPIYEDDVPPTDYTQFLPDANDYNKGHVMRVRPMYYYSGEDAIYLEEYDDYFTYANSKYYTIV